jgi:hypothetical protein
MTVDEMLDQHRVTGEGKETEDGEARDGAFGIIRAPRERALMIELHKRDGTILAVPYAMIEQMRYSPGEGITLHAGTLEIRIRGRHLTGNGSPVGLFSALASHRVLWAQEQCRLKSLEVGREAILIESIQW